MWVSRQMIRLAKQMSATIGKRVLTLNHYLAIHGDPILYRYGGMQTLSDFLRKEICEDCVDRALRKQGAWVVGCVPSKSNPNMVHLTDPVCENWRLHYGKPLCWKRSDQDIAHGYLIVPNLNILAALLVLEFPVYYAFDPYKPDLEPTTLMKLDEFNGWHYFVAPTIKAVKGETLKGVIIDAQLGLLKQIHGSPIILERGCI
jgi:hypothetical protein